MRITILIFFILLSNSVVCHEQQKLSSFAQELMSRKEYYRAITEYMRLNSYFPDHPEKIKNLKNIALCYVNANHEIEAINTYQEILAIDSENWFSIYKIAKLFHDISYYYESNNFISIYDDRLDISHQDSLVILSALNDIYLDKVESANEKLKSIKSDSQMFKKAETFKTIINGNYPLKLKSKITGVFLSTILPGGGYFYTKKIGTGFSALIVNSLLLYSTISSFEKNNDSVGILAGIGFASFYLGSIYGSIQAVNKYNVNIKVNFTHKFKL